MDIAKAREKGSYNALELISKYFEETIKEDENIGKIVGDYIYYLKAGVNVTKSSLNIFFKRRKGSPEVLNKAKETCREINDFYRNCKQGNLEKIFI